MLVCKECGNKNVQSKAWIDTNTNEYISTAYVSKEDSWCPDCSDHTGLCDANDFILKSSDNKDERLINLLDFLYEDNELYTRWSQGKMDSEEIVKRFKMFGENESN